MKSKAITLPAHLFADHAHYVKNKRSAHLRKKQKRGGRRRDHLKPTSLSVWPFKWNLSSKFFFTSRYNHIALSKQVLTFESMDESLRCDQSKENSSAIISHGTIFFPQKFGNFHKNRCTVYSDQSVLSLSSHR